MTAQALTRAPRTSWNSFEPTFAARWDRGEHVTIVAPTGFGKTHLALAVLEQRRYVLVLATKRQDPLVSSLAADGYRIVSDPGDIVWTAAEPREPMTPKVVYWPQFPEKTTVEQRLRMLSSELRHVLDWADKTGEWTLLVDETMFLTDQLGLEKSLNMAWHQGRSQGLSVVALAQRPARIPRLAFSQASYLFLGRFGDKRDLETLRDLNSSIPREIVEESVRTLSKEQHEFLFIDVARDRLQVVVAPPR